jgi:O-antigen/teichoic acid export membrane protein
MFRYLWKFTLQMGTLTFTLLALLAVFSEPIIKTFYGESYLSYQYMLIGFCALYVIIFLGYPLRYAIRTLQNTRLIFISFIASSVFSVMAAYPLITRFGLSGVLAGLMITQCISLVIYLWSLRRELRKL